MKARKAWLFALIPTIAMTLIALFPQFSLWKARGSEWAGSYAASNYDEVAYSAYVNGLIDGKPRKYDPMMGNVHEHESIFSLQFIPAYSIAVPARVLGVSASTAFIVLQALIAIFATLAIFYLFRIVTGDDLVSAAGVLIVLCLGTAATYEGSLRDMTGGVLVIEYLPFLRRYQPGFAFPIFFLMTAACWLSFTSENKKAADRYSTAAGLLFGVLVFSYFYLWTTAAAWLALLFGAAFLLERSDRKEMVRRIAIVGGIALAALVPYVILLQQRSRNSDEVQLLSLTHSPDLAAPTVVIGLITLVIAAVLSMIGRIDWRSPAAFFAYAFLLTPLVVLNQQVVTGRSLQPVHYEIFIANYCVLVGVVIIGWLAAVGRSEEPLRQVWGGRVMFTVLGVAAACWGFQEAWHATRWNAGMVAVRDGVYPAAEFIRDDAARTGRKAVVHTPNPIAGSFIPTVTTARVLWNPHLVAGGSIGESENKLQFYRFLYFSGFAASDLENALKTRWFEVTAAIFGGGRALPQLGGVNHPITDEEIAAEVEKYDLFIDSLDPSVAYDPELSHVVVPTGDNTNFDNVDRWYERDAGTNTGIFTVFTLARRPADQ